MVKDLHGNNKWSQPYEEGHHMIVESESRQDVNFREVNKEITAKKLIYDTPYSIKKIDELLKRHEKSGFIIEDIDLNIAYSSTNTRSIYSGNPFTIKNVDDFKNGNFEDLIQLGKRGLSSIEPSLERLTQPIEDDPDNSILKKKGERR